MSTTHRHTWFHALAAVLAVLACTLVTAPLALLILLTWGALQGLLGWAARRRWRWHGAAEWSLTTALLLAPWWLDAAEEPAQRVSLVLGVLQAAAWLMSHDEAWSNLRRRNAPLRGPTGWWSREDRLRPSLQDPQAKGR